MQRFLLSLFCSIFCLSVLSQPLTLIKPARVFDGVNMHTDWVVLVSGDSISLSGPLRIKLPAGTKIIELPGATLLPGLIEGHSHLFLHPYNETLWEDQVLKESRAERTARAVNHARATLAAGFTTVRDLGTEGAAWDDDGLKKAIEKGIIPGPRMIIATKAIVAKGTYAPKSISSDTEYPQGAAEVSGVEEMKKEVRLQISKGADLIKIYSDNRWDINGQAAPAFTVEEIKAAVEIAGMSGRKVVAHASTAEGMRRAILAGVSTIEHGDEGTLEIFTMMKTAGIGFCPTLAAVDAYSQYKGWKKGIEPEPAAVKEKRKSFQLALQSGVTICMGGDVGVYAHGDNVREQELMVAYGMSPLAVLQSSTSVNADQFGVANKIGRIKNGLVADLIAVQGDPSENISNLRKIVLVMKQGKIFIGKE